MKSLVAYNPGSGGGPVEDILKRLGNVETDVSDLKSKVSGILATFAHLATKADVLEVRKEVADLRTEMSAELGSLRGEMSAQSAELGSLRGEMGAQAGTLRAEMAAQWGSLRGEMVAQAGTLRAEMADMFGSLRAEMAARETAFIKWMIATVLAAAGLAFTIAKFVH
jgi:hypothetical protein